MYFIRLALKLLIVTITTSAIFFANASTGGTETYNCKITTVTNTASLNYATQTFEEIVATIFPKPKKPVAYWMQMEDDVGHKMDCIRNPMPAKWICYASGIISELIAPNVDNTEGFTPDQIFRTIYTSVVTPYTLPPVISHGCS